MNNINRKIVGSFVNKKLKEDYLNFQKHPPIQMIADQNVLSPRLLIQRIE